MLEKASFFAFYIGIPVVNLAAETAVKVKLQGGPKDSGHSGARAHLNELVTEGADA